VQCPKCGTEYPEGTNFCENDGTPLVAEGSVLAPAAPAAPAAIENSGCTCGRNEDDGSGYCTGCGMRLVPPDPGAAVTGHIATPPELAPAPALGAVTDRGIRHSTNQDAVAVALEIVDGTPVPVIVVCDGVSSARHAEEASAVAVEVACRLLAESAHDRRAAAPTVARTAAIASGGDNEHDTSDFPALTPAMIAAAADVAGTDAGVPEPVTVEGEAETRDLTPDAAPPVPFVLADPVGAMREAITQAHLATCALDDTPDPARPNLGPPGCTFVGAIVEPGTITIGWVGDSRAYWLAGDDSRLLTRDHSYLNDLIDAGQLTEETARTQHQHSHVITRCLGPLNGEGRTPPQASITQIPRPKTGMLLLCSDGLWNYAPEAPHLARLARAVVPGADAQEISRSLAQFAYDAGGQDNITVAVLMLGGTEEAGETSRVPAAHIA